MQKKDIRTLINKGKVYVSEYISSKCDTDPYEHRHNGMNQILDHLFDYQEIFRIKQIVSWIKNLMYGRRSSAEFENDVKQYDDSSKCNMVWTTYFVAYRCRTCAFSISMSLCTSCFFNGDHKGHDFNMFRSKSGGACDCGDASVMRPEGFCKLHCSKNTNLKTPPKNLLCITEEIIPRVLHYLIMYLREDNYSINESANVLIRDIFIYLCDLGTLTQCIIWKNLINKDIYIQDVKHDHKDFSYEHRFETLYHNYNKAIKELEFYTIFPNIEDIQILDLSVWKNISIYQPELRHKTYLDEIIFWAIINEFPPTLITFLSKILPHDEYKTVFAQCFLKHYSRVNMIILYPNTHRFSTATRRDISNNKLSTSMIHISVQLFSNLDLSLKLCKEFKLLNLILTSLKFGISGNNTNFMGILQEYTEQKNNQPAISPFKKDNVHYVVECNHPILRFQRYWPLISDLNILLTHKEISYLFLKDNELLDIWLEIILSFQAMNLNFKFTKADETNQNFKYAFLSELEIIFCTLWTIMSNFDENESTIFLSLTKQSLKWLLKWIGLISLNINQLKADKCTFHLPLHRHFSILLNNWLNSGFTDVINELLSIDQMELKSILAHPLQTLVATSHIVSNIWSLYGPNIRTQAVNYMQSTFCNSTIDADLFLVQQIITRIDPEEFIQWFFQIYDFVDTRNVFVLSEEIDRNRMIAFMENAFTLLAAIVAINFDLRLSSAATIRKEIIAILAVSDKTHSQIEDKLPYKLSSHKPNFVHILKDVANFRSPKFDSDGNFSQGLFYLKNDIWDKEYDPLFVLYRNFQRKEFQSSLERFFEYVKHAGKFHSSFTFPWPPFLIPAPLNNPKMIDSRVILNTKTLHAYFFLILYQAIQKHSCVSQHLLSIVIHLMELTLIQSEKDTETKKSSTKPINLDNIEQKYYIDDNEIHSWYSTNDFLENFIVPLKNLRISLKPKSKMINNLFYFENEPITEFTNCMRMFFLDDDQNVSNDKERMVFDSILQQAVTESDDSEISDTELNWNNSEQKAIKIFENFSKINHCYKSIDESILTLLLRLHSLISEKRDSFKTDQSSLQNYDFNFRVGNGPYFIGCLLKRFIHCCTKRLMQQHHDNDEIYYQNKVIEFINNARRSIWPNIELSPLPTTDIFNANPSPTSMPECMDTDEFEKSKRKLQTLERKKQIMNKFLLMQNEFFENNKSSFESAFQSDNSIDCKNESSTASFFEHKTYQCITCKEIGYSTNEQLFFQLVLNQSSTILINEYSNSFQNEITNTELDHTFVKHTSLPILPNDYLLFLQRKTNDDYLYDKSRNLSNFNGLNIGYLNINSRSGIHVHSCGHFIHCQCFNSLMEFLRPDEYFCPLCRKPFNSIVIIPPESFCKNITEEKPLDVYSCLMDTCTENFETMFGCHHNCDLNENELNCFLKKSYQMSIKYFKEKEPVSAITNKSSSFIYLTSIICTNMEHNIVLWRQNIPFLKNSQCHVPLFYALAINAKTINKFNPKIYYYSLWSVISGIDEMNIFKNYSAIPVLFFDCSSLLYQLIFAIPFKYQKDMLPSIVQTLLNLNFIQALVILMHSMNDKQKLDIRMNYQNSNVEQLFDYFSFIINRFKYPFTNTNSIILTDNLITETIAKICLPFLRLASITSHILFNKPKLPLIHNCETSMKEFILLATYLGLNQCLNVETTGNDFKQFIKWPKNPTKIIGSWIDSLEVFFQKDISATWFLLSHSNISCSLPKLLRLPKIYEHLFMFYHDHICVNCKKIPKDPAICLVCGKVICLRESCCFFNGGEGVYHAKKCGSGLAVYLSINSVIVYVICDDKFCTWGSMYLDEFGEEDRDLKRGKPLFLCEQLYELLEQQWITHNFLNINKRWILHNNAL